LKPLPCLNGATAFLALSVFTQIASGQVYFSKRGMFDESTGYMESKSKDGWFRGSATVARDSHLIYSCGHLFYEKGVWSTRYLFYRNYDGQSAPQFSTGVAPRGYRYFIQYATNVKAAGSNSARAFSYDFTVFYGNNSFGPAVDCWPNGAAAVRSGRPKQIVGYPAEIDYTGDSGDYYQHGTGWFPYAADQVRDDYYFFKKVSTGPGNSGGPIFVQDESGSEYALAGILVSGSYSTAGVYALNADSDSMASAALGLENLTKTFTNTKDAVLPDNGDEFVTRQVNATGFTGNVSNLTFNMSLNTPRRGDLDVYLRSPSGRIRWISKNSGTAGANLNIHNADYAAKFRGHAANGQWTLNMRDSVKGNRATFDQFSIAISAPAK